MRSAPFDGVFQGGAGAHPEGVCGIFGTSLRVAILIFHFKIPDSLEARVFLCCGSSDSANPCSS